MNGVERIAVERQRQITEEGYDTAHDRYATNALAKAAACYALPAAVRLFRGDEDTPREWPWDPEYWKPTPKNRIRELEKAGALIAAAIDAALDAKEVTDG